MSSRPEPSATVRGPQLLLALVPAEAAAPAPAAPLRVRSRPTLFGESLRRLLDRQPPPALAPPAP